MTIVAAAPLVLGAAACISFAFRKRLVIVAPFALAAIAAAAGLVLDVPPDSNGTLLDLELRVSPLGQLAALVILGTLLLLVLDVWLDEPAYNFFPTALAVGATALGVLVVTAPLAIFGLLVLGLLVPVGSFTFQIQRNRSVEAATRHFAFVALGGSLGIASISALPVLGLLAPAGSFPFPPQPTRSVEAPPRHSAFVPLGGSPGTASLALSRSLPHDQPATPFVLPAVVLVVAFALLLAAIPF